MFFLYVLMDVGNDSVLSEAFPMRFSFCCKYAQYYSLRTSSTFHITHTAFSNNADDDFHSIPVFYIRIDVNKWYLNPTTSHDIIEYVQTTMLEWTSPRVYNKKPVHPPSKHRQWGIYTTRLLWTPGLHTSVPKTSHLLRNAENRRGQPMIVFEDMISRGQHFSIRYSFERVNL